MPTLVEEEWQRARSLADLGLLTARWLEGSLSAHPACFAPSPDPETAPIAAVLALINRAGWVTEASQPGMALIDGSGQRAFVSLWCDCTVTPVLERAVIGTRLIMIAAPPRSNGQPARIPVSTWPGRRPCTWLGGRTAGAAAVNAALSRP